MGFFPSTVVCVTVCGNILLAIHIQNYINIFLFYLKFDETKREGNLFLASGLFFQKLLMFLSASYIVK